MSRAFSSRPAGNDVIGTDLGATNSCVALMEGKDRAMIFPREDMIYRERHCPPEEENLHRLIPAPRGYMTPFPWPNGRDCVHFANVPHKSLTVEKAVQNWVGAVSGKYVQISRWSNNVSTRFWPVY